jgi:hypothetical protein
MGSTKIDWERIEIVIEPTGEPNPQNPYAQMDQAHRDQALGELARTVLLRKVSENSGST